MTIPSIPELSLDRLMREAHRESGLWRLGYSYDKAMATSFIRTALECTARAKWARIAPKQPIPQQLSLLPAPASAPLRTATSTLKSRALDGSPERA